jgi:hypothetical protein
VGSTLLPVKLAGHATSTRCYGRMYGVPGVARDARGWHRRGARRSSAADSVHCRPYANPRVECPRWVGLTEGAAPSACDHNDCRKGVESYEPKCTGSRSIDRARDSGRTTSIKLYASNSEFGSAGPAHCTHIPMHIPHVRACVFSMRRWCGSGRQLSSTLGPMRRPRKAPSQSPVESASLVLDGIIGKPPVMRHRSRGSSRPRQTLQPRSSRHTWSRQLMPAGPMRSTHLPEST